MGRQTKIKPPAAPITLNLSALDRVRVLRAKVEELLGEVDSESSILTADEKEEMRGLKQYLCQGLWGTELRILELNMF